MARRILLRLIGSLLIASFLGGCLLNTQDRVVKRFVAHLKGMRWSKMAELIDWPQSAKYIPDLPAKNQGDDDKKKETMLRLAENLTKFPIRQRTTDQVRHEFLYLEIDRLDHIKDGKDWSWLEVTIATEARAKTVKILVMKVDRVWRIVLTDSIFE